MSFIRTYKFVGAIPLCSNNEAANRNRVGWFYARLTEGTRITVAQSPFDAQ